MSCWKLLFLCLLLKVEGKVKEEVEKDASGDAEISGDSAEVSAELNSTKRDVNTINMFVPYTEINAFIEAFAGYDVLTGDPFMKLQNKVSRDPGSKDIMFVYKAVDRHDADTFAADIDVVSSKSCSRSSNTKVVRTLEQFNRETGSSSGTGWSIGYENNVHLEVEIPDVPVEASTDVKMSAGAEFSNSESKKALTQFFKNKEGSVTVNSVSCQIKEVQLTEIPLFTDKFKRMLEDMSNIPDPTSEDAKTSFKEFVEEYGTHYRKRCMFGAELRETTFYNENSRRDFSQDKMRKCSNQGFGVDMLGAKAEYTSTNCKESDETKLKSDLDSENGKIQTSRGGDLPEGGKGWFDQKFDPVPISMTLEPFTKLMDKRILMKNDITLETVGKIQKVFFYWYPQMCDVRGIKCHEKIGGCGIDDACEFKQKCIDEGEGKSSCKAMPKLKNFARGRPSEISSMQKYEYTDDGYYKWPARQGNDGDPNTGTVTDDLQRSNEPSWFWIDMQVRVPLTDMRLYLGKYALREKYYHDLHIYTKTEKNSEKQWTLCKKYSTFSAESKELIIKREPISVKCEKDVHKEGVTEARLICVHVGSREHPGNAPLYVDDLQVWALEGSESPVNFAYERKKVPEESRATSSNGNYKPNVPSHAVDGDLDTIFTSREGNPEASLLIDMKELIIIKYIETYFTEYGVKWGYNKDLTLYTKDNGDYTICKKWAGTRTLDDYDSMRPWKAECDSKFTKARYVKLSTFSNEPLYVAEIEVYGFTYSTIDKKKKKKKKKKTTKE